MTKRYFEYFLCDAMRLATLLGGNEATLSDGIGNTAEFIVPPKVLGEVGDDIRFIRVEGKDYCEIAFISTRTPTLDDAKIRNKNYFRVVIGREIRRARQESGMELSELSRLTNLREKSLMRIEDGMWDIDTSLLGVILDALEKTIKIV